MPDAIYIGNFAKGLKLDRLPFNIDNDAFPYMFNIYSWRGRAKRKRGTIFLGQLQKQLQSSAAPNNWQIGSIGITDITGNLSVNLISHFSLETTAAITPGSITFSDGTNTFTETLPIDGTLTGAPAGSGTINYATGDLTITGGAALSPVIGFFSYFPQLPVMGLRDLVLPSTNSIYPLLIAFDTKYAYQINQSSSSVFFYNVTYYKNTNTPFHWNGQDYQQFWTTNYSGALWATNNVPGMQFQKIKTITTGNPTTITTDTPHGLISGDYVWFNEITGADAGLLNGTTQIITKTGATTFTVPVNTTGKALNNDGIFQTLTATSNPLVDGIRWYDGDPTQGTGLPTGDGLGWVNFAPPLTATTVSIDNLTPALYYLVGALAILPFKDRLLFFSPYIQTSAQAIAGILPTKLQDTVIWSWNGTPYYSSLVPAGETSDPSAYYVDQTGKGGYLSAGIAQPIITVNTNEDVLLIGFGGNVGRQTRFVYTGNDISPFLFFNINSELNASSTYSGITLDRGALTIGTYGIALTTQQSSQRIDLDIPDSVFTIQADNNGAQRVNAVRDFYKEWIYFDYPITDIQTDNNVVCKFPLQSFLWNYRDNTWAILYENFTAQGTYRAQFKRSWKTIGYKTWAQWREPWNSGASSPQFPNVIGGNPQGYVLIKGLGTGESISGSITAMSLSNGFTKITSVNHCVSKANPNTGLGDFLLFQGVLGLLTSSITGITQFDPAVITTANTFVANDLVTISGVVGMTELNGNTYKVLSATPADITIDVDSTNFTAYSSGGTVTSAFNGLIGKVIGVPDPNNFIVDIPFPHVTYLGLGKYIRLSQPLLQTKQFPVYWNEGRQVRLSVQKYLMDFTSNGQVTVNIYLSQDPDDIWNGGTILPTNSPTPDNNSLIYSQIMFTCPESTNIGLTPANTNLQMPTAEGQYQIWHRFNTSLIGDSIQIGITLSEDQMRNQTFATSEIALHGIHLIVDRGPFLA